MMTHSQSHHRFAGPGAFLITLLLLPLCLQTRGIGFRRFLLSNGTGDEVVHHVRRRRISDNVFDLVYSSGDDEPIMTAQKGYCGSLNPDKDCTGKKNAKKNRNKKKRSTASSSGDSSGSHVSERDLARKVMSELKKDRNNAIKYDKLRDKVFDALDVSKPDSKIKKKFKEAVEKLENKDKVKVTGSGVVKVVKSGDDSDSDSDSDSTSSETDKKNKKDNDKDTDDDKKKKDGEDDDEKKKDKDDENTSNDDEDDDVNADDGDGDGKDRPSGGGGDTSSDGTEFGSGGDDETSSGGGDDTSGGGDGTSTGGGDDDVSTGGGDTSVGGDDPSGGGDDGSAGGGDDPTGGGDNTSTGGDDDTSTNTSPGGGVDTSGGDGDTSPGDGDDTSTGGGGDDTEGKEQEEGGGSDTDSDPGTGTGGEGGTAPDDETDTPTTASDGTVSDVTDTTGDETGTDSSTGGDDEQDSNEREPPPSGSDPADERSEDRPNTRPNEIELYSGNMDVPISFQVSTEDDELTAEDIADIDAALGILSKEVTEEVFPVSSESRLLEVARSARRLIVLYNEEEPARVTDAEEAECRLSSDPGPCYDIEAATTLTLVNEDRGKVRDEYRRAMADAIASGRLDEVLRDINPDTTLITTSTDAVSDGDGTDPATNPLEGEPDGVRSSGDSLSAGGKAGIAILAVGVTAAVVAAIVATRKRARRDDESSLGGGDDGGDEDASIRRLRASAAALESTDQPGVYPGMYHQGAAQQRAAPSSYSALDPGAPNEDPLDSSGSEYEYGDEPSGAPGSFHHATYAPRPSTQESPSTPLIPAAAVAGAAALGAQNEGLVDLDMTTDDTVYEDDALQKSYDSALDAQIMASASRIKEGAAVDDILEAIPGSAEPSSESPDSSFEDDIRAAITSMEGEEARGVSPEREVPPPDYSSASEDESSAHDAEKKDDNPFAKGVAGLMKKFSSKNLDNEANA